MLTISLHCLSEINANESENKYKYIYKFDIIRFRIGGKEKEKKREEIYRYIGLAIFSTFQVARFLTRLRTRNTVSLTVEIETRWTALGKLVLMTRLFGYAALRDYRERIDFCGEDRLPIRAN